MGIDVLDHIIIGDKNYLSLMGPHYGNLNVQNSELLSKAGFETTI